MWVLIVVSGQLELATLMKRVDTAEQEHKIQRQQDLERSTNIIIYFYTELLSLFRSVAGCCLLLHC